MRCDALFLHASLAGKSAVEGSSCGARRQVRRAAVRGSQRSVLSLGRALDVLPVGLLVRLGHLTQKTAIGEFLIPFLPEPAANGTGSSLVMKAQSTEQNLCGLF